MNIKLTFTFFVISSLDLSFPIYCSHVISHDYLSLDHGSLPSSLDEEYMDPENELSPSSDTNDQVFITNVESGTVRLLPTLKTDDLHVMNSAIKEQIEAEKDDISDGFKLTDFVKNITDRNSIYHYYETGNMDPSVFDPMQESSDSSIIASSYVSPINFYQGIIPKFDQTQNVFTNPGWFSEQTDNENLISDYVSDLKKSALPEGADSEFYHIPINVNGTILFDIPKGIFETISSTHTFSDQKKQDFPNDDDKVQKNYTTTSRPKISSKTDENNQNVIEQEENNDTVNKKKIQIPAYLQYNNDLNYLSENGEGSYSNLHLLTRTQVETNIAMNSFTSPLVFPNDSHRKFNKNSQFLLNQEQSQNSPFNGIVTPIPLIFPMNETAFLNTQNQEIICQLPVDPGTCYLIFSRYYFNILTRKCELFNYTGCEGNLNNFITIAECETNCLTGLFFEKFPDQKSKYFLTFSPNLTDSFYDNITVKSPLYSLNSTHDMFTHNNEAKQFFYKYSQKEKLYNATMSFVISKLWTNDMDSLYSITRIALWYELEDFLKNAYKNESRVIVTLKSLNKHHDPYSTAQYTEATVSFKYPVDYSGSIEETFLNFLNSPMSSVYSFVVLKETISLWNDIFVSVKNICPRMEIPTVPICPDTPFGCCEDGVMLATGPDHQGCPEINCPCDEFLLSFVIKLTEAEFDRFNEDNPYGNSYFIYNELVDAINASYNYEVLDAYVDSRKCDAHLKNTKSIKPVYIIDMAIMLSKSIPDALQPIISLAKRGSIGSIPIYENSLIVTAAYGSDLRKYSKRSVIFESTRTKPLLPIFRLSFNSKNSGKLVTDSSGHGHHFRLSENVSLIKRRTVPSEYEPQNSCSGVFYPKRNEIATLDFGTSSNIPAFFNEMTFAFWLAARLDQNSQRKSGILYAVTETTKNDNSTVQKIWPAIKVQGNNLTASWGQLGCSTLISLTNSTEWSHFVVNYNIEKKIVNIFQNGNKISSCNTSNQTTTQYDERIKKLILGDSTNPFNGGIDEFVMYNTTLSEEVITSTYDNCIQDKKLSCKPECPPNGSQKGSGYLKEKIRDLTPISTCRQYLTRCNRHLSGIYKLVLPSSSFVNTTFSSPYRSLSTWCDMDTLDGGWTLLLSNPINSKWNPEEFINKNVNSPSPFDQFSILQYADTIKSYSYGSFEYMIKFETGTDHYGAILSVKDNKSSLLSKLNHSEEIVLVRKFGLWDYFSSSLSKRTPYVIYKDIKEGPSYPILTTSLEINSKEGVILDTFNNNFKLFQDLPNLKTGIISYWFREKVSPDTTVGGYIDISGMQAEITAYFFSVQIINMESSVVMIQYSLGGSQQFVKVDPKNNTILFTAIQSITMPSSISIRAFRQHDHKVMLLNCREELSVPVFFLKDDLFIANISETCSSLYPEMFEYYYDYIIYNQISESVVLIVKVLDVSNRFLLSQNSTDDWKGSVTYMEEPNFILSARTLIDNNSLLLNEQEYLSIRPQTQRDRIVKILIREKLTNPPKKIDKICYYSFEVTNDAIISVELSYRDDILLAIIDPGETIVINYQLFIEYEDYDKNEIEVKTFVHDIKLAGIVQTFINASDFIIIPCLSTPVTSKYFISSNLTDFKILESELKNRKITLDQKEEPICPPKIHGAYSPWSLWSGCNESCSSNETKTRFRTCNYPLPQNGGFSCLDQGLGADTETQPCHINQCSKNQTNKTHRLIFVPDNTTTLTNYSLDLLFYNTISDAVAVKIFTTDIHWNLKKFLNFSIKGYGLKNLLLNSTILPEKSYIKITSVKVSTGKPVKVGGNNELIIDFYQTYKNLSISIGNETDTSFKTFYTNVRFINNAGRTVRLIFSRGNSVSFTTNNFLEQGNTLAFKTRLNSLLDPLPYKVTCDSGDTTDRLYLNGQLDYSVYLFKDPHDLLLIIISDTKDTSEIYPKHINIIFSNLLYHPVSVSITTVFEVKNLSVRPGHVESYFQRIFSPIEIFANITASYSSNQTNEVVLIDSLQSIQYIAENSYNNIRFYTLDNQDFIIDLSNYFIKIRIVNLADQPGTICWRTGFCELFVDEGHEQRLTYKIKAATLPPALDFIGLFLDNSFAFVNGRNSSFLIPSKSPADYLTVLLSEVSDYSLNNTTDMIELNLTIQNSINDYVDLFYEWSITDNYKLTLFPNQISNFLIQAPASDPLVIEARLQKSFQRILVNGTSKLGILPSQFIANLHILITNKGFKYFYSLVIVRRVRFKLLNENNYNISILWKYGDISHSILVPNNTGIDLQLKLQDFGLNSTFYLFATNPQTTKKICVSSFVDEFSIESHEIDQLSQLSASNSELAWIVLTFAEAQTTCIFLYNLGINRQNNLTKILALRLVSNNLGDIYLRWSENDSRHSLVINLDNSSLLVFSCFDNCLSSSIQISAVSLNRTPLLVNGLGTLTLPYSSEFNVDINPVVVFVDKANYTTQSTYIYTYHPIIVNTLNEPVLLLWKLKGAGWERYILPTYSQVPLLINFSSPQTIELLIKAMSLVSQSFYLINSTQDFLHTQVWNCPPYCYKQDLLFIHNQTSINQLKLGLNFENYLINPVIISLNDGDQVYQLEGLGELTVDLAMLNQTQLSRLKDLKINAFDKNSGYMLKLNESLSEITIPIALALKTSLYITIKSPDLPVIPTNSFTFNDELLSVENPNDNVFVHGTPKMYTNPGIQGTKSQGLYLDGVDTWIGLYLQTSNCLVNPDFCTSGLSFEIKILIPLSIHKSDDLIKIIDSGTESGSSPGVSLQYKGNKLICRVTSSARNWQTFTLLNNGQEILIIISWNQDEGLNLYANGSLVSTDPSGEPILSSHSVEMMPNLLLGRGFNNNENNNLTFVIFSLTIFPKNLREKEAIATYLYLINNQLNKAIITNLRVVNDFGRIIRLIPNKGLVPSSGLLIEPAKEYQILSLIDFFSENPSQSETLTQRSNIMNQKLSIYAEDYELGTPLYINNHASPFTFNTNINNDDYINLVVSSKAPDIDPSYHWVFRGLIESNKTVAKTFPPVFYQGQVVVSKDAKSSLFLDGFTSNLLIKEFPYTCIFNPGLCDKGTTLMIQVHLEEALGGSDNTIRFILDTGGHSGEGFSLYLLGGRIIVEVSLNKQVWKVESGISYGEWLLLLVTWDPHDGGKLELYSNGKLLGKSLRSVEKQSITALRNQTILIGTTYISNGNEQFGAARLSLSLLSIFDQYMDKAQVLLQFLFFWKHQEPANYPRFINVNFENRAGVNSILKPDKGEHRDSGYNINSGLMLELRLEEKGPVTTYPVIFKAFDSNTMKSLQISGENSLLVMSEEDPKKLIQGIITSKLSCTTSQGVFKDPSQASNFITCQDGIAMRQSCPIDSLWDDELKACKPSNLEKETVKNGSFIIKTQAKNETILSNRLSALFIFKNLANVPLILSEENGKFSSFSISGNTSVTQIMNFTDNTVLDMYATSENTTSTDTYLVQGLPKYTIQLTPQINTSVIFIYAASQIIHANFSIPTPVKVNNSEAKTTSVPQVTLKTTPRPFTPTETPLLENSTLIRFVFVASNLLPYRVKIEETNFQLNTIELRANQTVRVVLQGDVHGPLLVFKAKPFDSTLDSRLKMNGLDELKLPLAILASKEFPAGAIVIHTSDQEWKLRRNLLLRMIHAMKKIKPEYKSVYMRIYKAFSDPAVITENSGSSFEIKLNQADRLFDTTALDVSLRVLRSFSQLKLSSFIYGSKEFIFINGKRELIVPLSDNFTSPLPIVVHMQGQNWKYFFDKIQKSLGVDNNTHPDTDRQFNRNGYEKLVPQDMVFLIVTFINTANEDVRIKSISGPLLIDTIFRRATTSRITMWLPTHSQVELIALDRAGNILLLNGNSTIIIDTERYPSRPFYITSPNINDDFLDHSQEEINDFPQDNKNSQVYKIRTDLNHERIKLFVIGKNKQDDLEEKIYSFPMTDQLVLEELLLGEKIVATDNLNGNLLSINGKPYFQEKDISQYKKDYMTDLSITFDQNEKNQGDIWPKHIVTDEGRLKRWLDTIHPENDLKRN